jgi:type IV pilus assembly protein PilW
MQAFTPRRPLTARSAGFTLVELLVAMALGMLLTVAMAYVYLNSKTAFSRQQQLGGVQQSVRTAFDYLSTDSRTAGHVGCYTGLATVGATTFTNNLSATALATNYGLPIEGYEYSNATAGTYTLTSSAPADITTAASWATNVATNAINTIPVSTIAGSGNGLTPGSDVLVIRNTAGRPQRLTAAANAGTNQTTLAVETTTGTDYCNDGTTLKVAGLCTGSHALIASCTNARVFQVGTLVSGTVTLASSTNLGTDPVYATDATEVLPMQTIVYYVKRSTSGTTTSLYRRIFDGDRADCASCSAASGQEQELVEGVESMQVRYGVDTTATPDGVVDVYVAAKGPLGDATDSVTDWSRVVSVRIGLLVRSTQPVEGDLAASLPASAPVNGVALTYPSSGSKYDRRVFTTTVAVRNNIAY